MSHGEPLVSIGMPVYNGAEYVGLALDSLLTQDYRNFELNICDNASTDDTAAICQSYCARDPRLHYHRNPTNIGMLPNWARVFDLASGDLFMWAACDDRWSSNYVRTLVACLVDNPQAVLAAGLTRCIDADGNLHPAVYHQAPARDLGPAKQLLQQHAIGWFHGMFRKQHLKSFLPTLLSEDPWGADVVLLLEICLATEVVGSDSAIIYKRLYGSGPKAHGPRHTPRQKVRWQCWFATALLRRILHSSLPWNAKVDMAQTCARYLKRAHWPNGFYSLALLWSRAGYHRLLGVDRN